MDLHFRKFKNIEHLSIFDSWVKRVQSAHNSLLLSYIIQFPISIHLD